MTDRRRRTAALRRPLPLLPEPLLPRVVGGLPADGRGAGQALREGQSPSSSPSSSSSSSSQEGSGSGSGSDSGSGSASGSDSGSDSGSGSGSRGRAGKPVQEDNPFAPPPEGRPDQPWQPRRPARGNDRGNDSSSDSASGRSPGGVWSNRQPGRGEGPFGGTGGNDRGPGGPEGPGGGPGAGLRWDPMDPAQRRARYALLAGMWAFFFAVFSQQEISLLLGALALYWGISSLRNKAKPNESAATAVSPAPAPTPPVSTRPQTTAAVSGLVTAALALMIVAATFTVQMVYRDYYTCVADSLTKSAQLSCNDELPKSLVPVFGVKE
ncbi:hypothetical protein ACFYVL_28645 [Streptomyces sp. NPDC004111]|uniref:hypothetical protein n=1 Tax=Streptomyces sp. NPDC004111 TaxID=3364690 RepID=UPI00367ADA43